jgi:hypothetical protein
LHKDHLAAIEKKLIEEELDLIEHNEKIKQNVGVNKQFENLNKYKHEEL